MTYHHIQVKTNSILKPNFLIGSALRGAFGYVLKDSVCTEPSLDCSLCKDKNNCIYYNFYEGNVEYRPFRFETVYNAENYDFSLYLFGSYYKEIRVIVSAIYRMLTLNTITDKNLSFPKSEIWLNGKKLEYNKKRKTIMPFDATPLELDIKKNYKDAMLIFRTPLIIKKNNLNNSNILNEILLSVYKRKEFFETGKIVHSFNHEPKYNFLSEPKMELISTKKRSDRQNRYFSLSGLMGKMVITDLDEESFKLLMWSEILGVGAKTTISYGVTQLIY